MRTVTLVLALAVSAVVLTAALPMADAVEQVILLDECDPVTFNLALGPGTCVNVGGKVTLTTFLAALPAGQTTPGPNHAGTGRRRNRRQGRFKSFLGHRPRPRRRGDA